MSVRNLPELQGLLSARLFQDRFNPYHMQSAKIGVEGEKRAKKRKSESFGGLLGTLGKVTQEGQDLLRGQGFRFPVTKSDRKLGEQVEIIPERVFFEFTLW